TGARASLALKRGIAKPMRCDGAGDARSVQRFFGDPGSQGVLETKNQEVRFGFERNLHLLGMIEPRLMKIISLGRVNVLMAHHLRCQYAIALALGESHRECAA